MISHEQKVTIPGSAKAKQGGGGGGGGGGGKQKKRDQIDSTADKCEIDEEERNQDEGKEDDSKGEITGEDSG